ncbi:maltokinase N-terminal cap-like domain-containing protein [Streptomyces chryseus]
MAVIHTTTLSPSKLELLTSWLPSQPWYEGEAGEPRLAKAGGFRLDDPDGEVGIEIIVVTDTSGARPVSYLVPLTYRGRPLDGSDNALVGIMEHGVLGRRWAYDACHDPVFVAQMLALIEGRVHAQDQDASDTPDQEVARSYAGAGPMTVSVGAAAVADDDAGTEVPLAQGHALRLHRVLRPAPDGQVTPPEGATGHVAGAWNLPDGNRARALFAVLHTASRS